MWCLDKCTKQCSLGTIGVLLSLFGFLMGIFWIDIFTIMLGTEMALSPTSRSFEPWNRPPLPLKLDIYFFNLTNPEDLNSTDPNAKPILNELGPYRFTEKPEKVDIVWHPDNSSVSFKRKSLFYFDEDGSNGTLNDYVSTLNIVSLAAAATTTGSFQQSALSAITSHFSTPTTVLKTVDELLFTGYEDYLIDLARTYADVALDGTAVPFDRFGWFYTRNGSAELTGHFNMLTGQENIKNIGKMNTWNYKKHSGFFDSYCGLINGSAGEFFPPNLRPGDAIFMFTPDMCRTLRLDYAETVKVHDIEGLKFSGGLRSVDNGTLYPENKCFCGGECLPSGVMNISACRFGTPVFMSYPHYFNADPFFINQVEGIKPEKEKHEFYMILEPTTGVPLEVAARFQVNALIDEFPKISMYKGYKKTFIPLLWFEQRVQVPRELTEELKYIPIVVLAGHIVSGILFAIGLIMACWVPIDTLVKRNRGELKPQKKKSSKSKSSKTDPNAPAKKDLETGENCPEVSPLLKNKREYDKVVFTSTSEPDVNNLENERNLQNKNEKA